MTLKKAPNKEGATRNYITRSQALKKLQVSLKDFQRLCILKGVYPRDVARGGTLTSKGINRRKLKKDKIYYHVNDVRYLGSGDLLAKFRDISAHLKRHRKLVTRGELYDAKLVERKRPRYSLATVVKERCPALVNAVADLDDAVSTIAAVAALPANKKKGIEPKVVDMCQMHLQHFLKYVSETRCLKKTFISIKGFYFQAEILEETVTWILPHCFAQEMPDEVDFNVIATFVEYYIELVKLVNFKLYSMAGLSYPPKVKPEFAHIGNEFVYMESTGGTAVTEGLFNGMRFSLSPEVPLVPTCLVILSAGGTITELENATHVIVDRPVADVDPTKDYVQPQYVFDCLNCGILLPVQQYAIGVPLPHHLSPFVDDLAVPDRQLELDKLVKEASQRSLTNDDPDDLKTQRIRFQEDIKKETTMTEEMKQMSKALMPKKTRRLLSKIEFGERRKAEAAEKLRQKKEAIKRKTK
ncbi:pescadillo N-terminus family protein, putative [Babesia bigemina]|uniref:Pescadillo homolog n=1 Tax=Babesia bigemina TaxID=5866 RepID=A0A061D3R1_BABBI|nr:pescadillo N-terminus family protein, putative [Babesia bigemina]CDR95218.1 pescadillo N-terminus family protein, putative [Babesia bigemina]|eukprot:XP_012767404.1 pescadillo N-terminus family protein, putative [Babesia bigemina]